LVDRRNMFHPHALLDGADLAPRYLEQEPWKNSHVPKMFASQQDYLDGLSVFLFLAALVHETRHANETWPLYPGFKLISGASRAVRAFLSKLSSRPNLVRALADMANEDVREFKDNWPQRARRLNDAQLGGQMDIRVHWARIPEQI
jgi:hypothetical protein